jgi:subtilisin family serine protease
LKATIPGAFGAAANLSATGVLTGGQLSVSSGDQQKAAAGAALPLPLVALVRTNGGNPVAGVSVDWQIATGGGNVSAPASLTNAQGQASISWTLGGGSGAQSVQASSTGRTPATVTFGATSVVPTPGSITGGVTVANGFLAPPVRARSGAMFSREPQRSNVGGVDGLGGVVGPSAPPINDRSGDGQYIPHTLIVSFRPEPLGAPPAATARALASTATAQSVGAAMRAHLRGFEAPQRLRLTDVSPVILAARLTVLGSADMDSIAAVLRRDPAVQSVSRDRRVYAADARVRPVAPSDTIPNDPLYPVQSWNYTMIDLPRAWEITRGSSAVTVAVIDNGIRLSHPGLAANLLNDGYDFVSQSPDSLCAGGHIDNADDGDGYDPDPTIPDDFNADPTSGCLGTHASLGGHGIGTASIIGAVGNDGLVGTGVNWTVRIRPVRALGLLGGTAFDVAQAILYSAGLSASDGKGGTVPPPTRAPILSLSLGGGCPGLGDPDFEGAAVQAATTAGSLVIAASGNDSQPAPHCPAAYPQTLSVSAVGPNGLLAPYSNFASITGIAAPGGDFTQGTDATTGVLIMSCDFTTTPCTPNLALGVGTSFATPHVSGVAALLLAANPGLTNAQLRSLLTTYAVDTGPVGPDAAYGAGILNARNSLTQTLSPPVQVYARLYDAATGAIVATQQVAGDGSFSFNSLAPGSYYVFAGGDENADGLIGVPGRVWGAFGGTARPTALAVSASAGGVAFFAIGLPTETEANDALASADRLPVGGYVHGTLTSGSDAADIFKVGIPQAGQYTFETTGWQGAFCRFALNVNTILTLSDSNGVALALNNDDPNAQTNEHWCATITRTLAVPGNYFLTVAPGLDFNSPGRPGRGHYRIAARSGP